MALATLLAVVALQGAPVPFKSLGDGVARTPQVAHAKVIRDRRAALDFLMSLKSKGARFLELKYDWDWKKNEAVVVYAGYVPVGSKLSVGSLVKDGSTATVTLTVARGSAAEMHYAVTVLRVPKSGLTYQLAAQ